MFDCWRDHALQKDHIGFWTILSSHLIEALFHLRGLLSFFGRAIWQKWQRV
jgi:hypothetical protein